MRILGIGLLCYLVALILTVSKKVEGLK